LFFYLKPNQKKCKQNTLAITIKYILKEALRLHLHNKYH